MILMDYRQGELAKAANGFKETNIPLISLHEGIYSVAGFSDDQGVYYFIPWIAKTFHISVELATNLFFNFILLLPVLVCIFCFFSIFKDLRSRLSITVVIGLLATYCAIDLYAFSFFAACTVLPLFIFLNEQEKLSQKMLLPIIAFSSIVIGYCNIMRSQAGTAIFLFLFFWLFLNQNLNAKKKGICLLTSLIFTLIPYLHFNYLEQQRDAFLQSNYPNYIPISASHPKWHAIFLGLSYIPNSYGINWEDETAFKKAQSIDKDVVYCSEKYEQILKEQCLLLIKKDPIFILKNIFAKMGAILLKILICANLGLFLIFYVQKSLRFHAPFLIALAYSALPGLLVIPNNHYLRGLLTTSTLWGLYLLSLAIQKYQRKSIVQDVALE
jgi:hypothetical protein